MPTPITSRLQFQDTQFKVDLTAGPWKWTTRVDLSKSIPTYQVRDVVSPYGLLRDSIPLPGEVVEAMAASIVKIQTAFTPKILLDTAVLTFSLDEGRGASLPQTFHITNNGVYGSLLAATISSSAPYAYPTPGFVGGLAVNEAGEVAVTADSTTLLAANSPYAATLTVQDAGASNSPQTVAVSIVVRPKATIAVTPADLDFLVSKPLSGPYPPVPSQTFSVVNAGPAGSELAYSCQKLTGAAWLTNITPLNGTLASGATAIITAVVAPPATMLPGAYYETIRVSGYSSNFYVDINVTLIIT